MANTTAPRTDAAYVADSKFGPTLGAVLADVSSDWSDEQHARVSAVVSRVMEASPSKPEPVTLDPIEMARAIEIGFRDAVTKAIAQAHRANLAVPFAGPADALVWLHPDGTLRDTRDA